MSGFSTKGQHISDLGFRLISRNASPPDDVEVRESIFGVQGDYDFSMILGEPIKENRLITYVVRARETERARFRLLKTKLENWLLDGRISPIYDDYEIGYHYLGKCIGIYLESDDSRGIAMCTITFDCYPFKISELKEGHDIWDEFNFELDVAQPITFHPMGSTFRPLKNGDTITIGIWSTHFDGLGKIEHGLLGRSYKVGSVRSTTQGDSARAYYISELGQWLIEQDAVEAQEGAVEVNLINAGVSSVAPTIETDIDLTIVREDEDVFNLKKGTIKSDLFRLYPGENKMIISGWTRTRYEPGNVNLTWHKELI